MSYYEQNPFPDAEKVAMKMLSPIATTYVVTPPTIHEPIIRVQRTGGSDDGITDYPRIDVECVAPTRHLAWQMAEQVRQTFLASPRQRYAGATVDRAETEVPPQQIPDDNQDIRRVVATYRLAMRRPVSL